MVGGLELLVGRAGRLGGALEGRGGLLQLVVADLELRLGQGELPAPLGDADLQLVVGPPQGLLGALDPLADPPGDPRAEHGAHQEGDDRPDRGDQRREPPPGDGGDPVGRPRGRCDGAGDERQELAHQSGADRRPAQRAEQEAADPAAAASPTPSTTKLKAVFSAIGIVRPP